MSSAPKPESYYSRVRKDYVDALPVNPDARILELGCAEGTTGAYALEQGKCGSYYGIELVQSAADIARSVLTEVICGNVEAMEIPWEEKSFDVLIMSEVLEHLIDPWSVLKEFKKYLKPGALVFASSPNVSHHIIIRGLLKGRFELTEDGPMDWTHMRWFTPRSFEDMFRQAGYEVDSVDSVEEWTPKAKFFNFLTRNKLRHLAMYRVNFIGHVRESD